MSIILLTSVYGNYLPYLVMERLCITVNLLIDQNIILYLLLHEINCLHGENFLECVLAVALSLSIGNGVTFH